MTPVTPEEIARRVRAHELWACPDCLPSLTVAAGDRGALIVTTTHAPGCQAVAYWLFLSEPGPPPGAAPTNPHDPFTNPAGGSA